MDDNLKEEPVATAAGTCDRVCQKEITGPACHGCNTPNVQLFEDHMCKMCSSHTPAVCGA
jgi:hypothetical protein